MIFLEQFYEVSFFVQNQLFHRSRFMYFPYDVKNIS